MTAQRAAVREQAASAKWGETVKESKWMWGEYQRKWPPEERPPVDRSDDPPDSWHGDGNRRLKPAENGQVESACDRIAERERDKISPAMRAVESQDPDRHLIGLEHCLKGRDRIKEKVYRTIKELRTAPRSRLFRLCLTRSGTPFSTRRLATLKASGQILERLKDQGFKLDKLKNSWSEEQYKGINSQWIEPDTGQRFEVQFHTRISFEAKQLTHGAYERLRSQQADIFEELVLEAFQKKVTGDVPVPPGADGIPDYPERGADAR